MSETPVPAPAWRCEVCGGSETLLLAPYLCAGCTNGPASGEPWQPGEVGYELRLSADRAEQISGHRPSVDPLVVGPLRSRSLAIELSLVWGAAVAECVPVPAACAVGADLVTVGE